MHQCMYVACHSPCVDLHSCDGLMFGSSQPLSRFLPPRHLFYFHHTMPKRQSVEDASSSWVDAHFERWNRDRGSPERRSPAESSTQTTEAKWAEMAERAKQFAKEKLEAKRASEGVASASGAGRPVFEQEGFTAEEAKMYWRELANGSSQGPNS